MEIWIHQFAFAGKTEAAARQIEAWGYDGMLLADSQDLTADIWVELALGAQATDRLRLGPGVTNFVTRHPVVTASAAATLQIESGGRVEIVVARGDSAVSKLGLEAQSVERWESDLGSVKSLLEGGAMTVAGGTEARLEWLPRYDAPPVRVAAAASGPHAIAAAAMQADVVYLTVGAEAEELKSAIGEVRGAAGERPVSIGAFLNVGVADDPARAREMIRGSVATLARFSDKTHLFDRYEEATHGQSSSAAAQGLSDGFIETFGVCGTPEQVTGRLRELTALGLDRIVMVPGSLDADQEAVAESNRLFAEQVIPAIR